LRHCPALLIAASLAAVPPPVAFAQAVSPPAAASASIAEKPPATRPTICLVLSGGGARGFAHVGVLKVLEELRIPIDCIAGTSMGAVVGGLYASGLSAAEIERIFRTTDWSALQNDVPSRRELPFRRKADDFQYPLGLEVGVKRDGPRLPDAVLGGTRFEMMLREWTRHVPATVDFDKLAIPYRAVATDMESGEPVVFKSGRLHEAIRASMSVPGLFQPIELDGRLLGDGGLVRNLPVDIALQFRPEVVIAVNIGTQLARRSQLRSMVDISQQMVNIMGEQTVRDQLARLTDRDILIQPDLGDRSFLAFEKFEEVRKIGEDAARKLVERLRPLAPPPGTPRAAPEGTQAATPPPEGAPGTATAVAKPAPGSARDPGRAEERLDFVRFASMRYVNPDALMRDLETRAGQPFDPEAFRRDITRLLARGDFARLDWQFVEEDGRRGLEIIAEEKSWGPQFLRFGLQTAIPSRGDTRFNLSVGHLWRWVNRWGAEWRNDVQLGSVMGLRTEFYQPITPGNAIFLAPYWSYERRPVGFFERGTGQELLELRRTQRTLGLDLGVPIAKFGEARLGVARVDTRIAREIGVVTLPTGERFEGVSASQAGASGRVLIDQLDDTFFPREGYRLSASVLHARRGFLGSDERATRWGVETLAAASFGNHTFNVALDAGRVFTDRGQTLFTFSLGGFQQLSGLRPGELAGDALLFGRLTYLYPLANVDVFGRKAFIGGSLEAGNVWADSARDRFSLGDMRRAASVFLGAQSFLGPLYFGYGRASDRGSGIFYIFIGRP
jgi:NTE family protein